jgi:O-antigen/teichoic acid export membrane protein
LKPEVSLTDKVIKNTFYHLLSQIAGFIFPLILTPFIIAKIGQIEFGIYAIVLGFTGTFGLFDLSISSSFIKFISEHYNRNETVELNHTINSGLFFYLIFTIVFIIAGYFFTVPLLSLLNIPAELKELSIYAFRVSLMIFFVTNSFVIFTSVLISLQKMYVTSVIGTLINSLSFAANIILLLKGFGLKGLLWVQLSSASVTAIVSIIAAKRFLPSIRIGLKYFSKRALKKMTGFGIQMEISKLASFASEKYDEFLLGFFSVMNNVTYYNISGRISRFGKFLPFQVIPQVAPVAAELKAKEFNEKLVQLYRDTIKYLTIISVPIFVYLFIFADTIIFTWMGPGYDISAHLLRILAAGNLINLAFSAPGNSITPNIGIPKYQMNEGLINLGINLVLSFILIKYYGIFGAAIGNTVAVVISSMYVFYVSSKFFKQGISKLFAEIYFKPLLISLLSGVFSYAIYLIIEKTGYEVTNRISGVIMLLMTGIIFIAVFSAVLFNISYLNERDRSVLTKIISKIIPLRYSAQSLSGKYTYHNEKVSICILTCNRVDFLRKCISSLLPTLDSINYELIIWDNNSADGTKEYLESLKENKNINIILNSTNIGTQARGKMFEMTKGEYLVCIDDDVLKFPENWLQQILSAYNTIPYAGFLSTDVVKDETTNGGKQPDDSYHEETFNDGQIKFLSGPAGGWCFMISRKVYRETGKFYYPKGRLFFSDDGDYALRVLDKGFRVGILKEMKVYHATGEYHNRNYKHMFDEKMRDYEKGTGSLHLLRRKISKILSYKRYMRKLIILESKN